MGDAHEAYLSFLLDVDDAASSTGPPNTAKKLTKNQEVDKPRRSKGKEKLDTGLHQSLYINKNKNKAIPPEAQKLIGIVVFKKCLGVSYLGTVVDYDVNRKWFRIEYDDEGSEDLEEKDVVKYLASTTQINEHLKRARNLRRSAKRKQKKRASGKGSTPRTSRKKSDPSCRRNDGTYIPLVYRATKKDDYYWY